MEGEAFDPDTVERMDLADGWDYSYMAVDSNGLYIHASNYDKLLLIYREALEEVNRLRLVNATLEQALDEARGGK